MYSKSALDYAKEKAVEAKDAEIALLRALVNDALYSMASDDYEAQKEVAALIRKKLERPAHELHCGAPVTETAKIVERLRATAVGHPYAKIYWPHRLMHEAADEIERLQREVASRGLSRIPNDLE